MATTRNSITLHNAVERIGYKLQSVDYDPIRFIFTMNFIYKGYSIPIEISEKIVQELWNDGLDNQLFRRMIDSMLDQVIRNHASEAQS